MNYQNRPFPAGLDGQGRFVTRQVADDEFIPTEAAASATEIGADDFAPADAEVLAWFARVSLKVSLVILCGLFAWHTLDYYAAGFLA